MKKLFTILFLFVSFIALSQNNGINFQGVGRNSSGAVLASTKISLRFSVIQNSETGTVEYVESKEVTTNAQGIFSVVIGDGTQTSKTGNFSDINWKINPKFLKVEMDPAGGSSFVAMGTTRLQSVPFAYYANGVNADNVDGVLSASKGGTGVASISALKTALAIDQINNTSDLAKPISTATQAALDTKVSTSTFSTTIATKANAADIALKANVADLALKAPIDSPTFTGTVGGITKAMVGLSSVDNTSDLSKPVSTATQAALDLKASSTTLALKENVANKSSASDLGGLNPSNVLFPTQKAVKDYITANAASGGIADGGVTSIKIANGAVGNSQLASNSINSTNIIDGTITNADINTNASIPFSKLNITKADIESLGIPGSDQNTTYTAGTGLTLSGTTFSIGTGAITSTAIADGTITNVDINSSAGIDYTKLNLAGSIVSSDISNSAAIPFSKLNIAKSDIVGLGIPGSDQNTTYTAGSGLTLSGTTFSIGAGAITSTNIADGTITNVDINSSAGIDYTKLNLAGSIGSSDISNSAAIPFSKLNIAKSDIVGLGIPGSDQNTTYTAGNGLTLSGTTFSIGTGAITSTNIADGTITNVDINSSAGIDYTKLNLAGSIGSSDISNSAAIPFSKLNITKANIEALGIPGSDQNTTYTAGNGLTLSGTTFSIGAGAITSTNIADGTITNVDINSSAGIDYTKLNLAGSIVSSDISNSAAIPFSKLNIAKSDIVGLGIPGSDQNTTYTAGNGLTLSGTTFSIGTGAITSTNIADGTISNVDINSSAAIDYSKLNLANSIVSGDLTSAAITTSKLADGAITNSKISGPISVINGGTGTSTLLTNAVILGNGTSTVQFVAPGASGNVLKSNGTTWISDASSGGATTLNNLSDAKVEGSAVSPNYYDFTGSILLGHKNLTIPFTGLRTTAIGIGAIQNLNSGNDNTAIGYNSMKLLYQGDVNTAVGSQALYSVYSGSYNTAVGVKSLYSNTALHNVAIGYFSLYNNTTGTLNTAIGSLALQTNVSGIRNTAIGYYSLGTSTGDGNTATGFNSLYLNTSGYGNTGFGFQTLQNNTTGYYNTSIGFQSGSVMTSGNNNTLIGYNSSSSTASVNNEITLGNSSITNLRSAVTSITSLSDRRDKTDIIDISEGLNFIKQLKPVSFTWNTRDKAKVGIKSAGFIAQDLLSLQKSSSIGDNLDLVSEDNPEKLEARYNNLLPVMVKAIQDQQAIIDELKKELEAVKKLIQKP